MTVYSVYNSHVALQDVCVLDRSLKFLPPTPIFSKNAPKTFNLLFCLNNNFQTKKFEALRLSFDGKLISPNMSRDMLKHVSDLHMSQIVITVLVEEI